MRKISTREKSKGAETKEAKEEDNVKMAPAIKDRKYLSRKAKNAA